jgi:hypothetical protein
MATLQRTTRFVQIPVLLSLVYAAVAFALAIGAPRTEVPAICRGVATSTWYVRAYPPAEGPEGTRAKPFTTLAGAQAASAVCDTIVVLHSDDDLDLALDGGITLKDGQKLIGEPVGSRRPRITNSTDVANGGHGVVLANDNEVANVHVDATYGSGIRALSVTGVNIHDDLITRANASKRFDPDYASRIFGNVAYAGITLVSGAGTTVEASVKNTVVSEGNTWNVLVGVLGDSEMRAVFDGIVVLAAQLGPKRLGDGDDRGENFTASAEYGGVADIRITGSRFEGGAAYETEDNIWVLSNIYAQLNILVKDSTLLHVYNNNFIQTVGTGQHAKSVATLERSTFDDAYDNVEQFSEGLPSASAADTSDSISTTIRACVLQNARRWGIEIAGLKSATFSMMVSETTITGSAATGLWIGTEVPSTYTVDLGEGAFGSPGLNRIFGNVHALRVQGAVDVIAQHNWWGSANGLLDDQERTFPDSAGNISTIDASEPLTSDPGS